MVVEGIFVLFGIGVAVYFYVIASSVKVSARDVAWLAAMPVCPLAEADVYSRYLQRHRRHRLAGGLFGVTFAATVGIRWFSSISIGIGQRSPLADVLFCGLAGVLVGSLSAESFRLSEPPSSTVAASLLNRDGSPQPDLTRAARGLTIVSLSVGGFVAATGNGLASLSIATVGLAAALVAEATRAAISGRRRPVLSDRAQTVDLRIRSFAGRSVALLQLAAAVLVAGWTLAKVPGIDNQLLTLIRFLAEIGSLALTVILLHKAAPRPPRHWSAEPS